MRNTGFGDSDSDDMIVLVLFRISKKKYLGFIGYSKKYYQWVKSVRTPVMDIVQFNVAVVNVIVASQSMRNLLTRARII